MSDKVCGYIYIIESASTGKYYLGSTIDPDNRLMEHNSGESPSTRNKGPWFFVAIIEFETIVDARRTEQWLKRMHRKEVVDMIIDKSFDWSSETKFVKYLL